MDEVFIRTQQNKMQRDHRPILIDKVKIWNSDRWREKNATSSLCLCKASREGWTCMHACPRKGRMSTSNSFRVCTFWNKARSGSLPASVSKGHHHHHHSRFAATEFTLPISHPLYEQDVSEWWVWLGEILIDKQFLLYFLETKLSYYYYLNQKYYKVSFSSRFSKFIIPLSLKYALKEVWRRKILYLKLFLKLEY